MRDKVSRRERIVKLIIEPADGVAPLLAAIKSAKKSVEIAIFRFDRKDVEAALRRGGPRRPSDRLDRICQSRRRTRGCASWSCAFSTPESSWPAPRTT